MRTTIDRAGRIVVPRELRDRLGVVGGETVELEEHDGVLEISVVPAAVEIVATPDGPVIKHREDAPAVTDELIRDTLDRIRR